ncbi:VOC family protein [Chloroflexota bacterium]
MKSKSVNRVVIAVRDLDKAVSLYSRLLDTVFHEEEDVALAASYGIRASVSWDAGIEIVSPIPENNAAMGQAVTQFIDNYGGGLYSVVFSVDNVDEAYARATEMGIHVSGLFELDQEQIGRLLNDKFKKFKQYTLRASDTCGVQVVLGQIEPK